MRKFLQALRDIMSSMLEHTWSLVVWPFRTFSTLFSGRSGGGTTGQQTADAADQATRQVTAADEKAAAALNISQIAGLVIRSASVRARGGDYKTLTAELAPALGKYIASLTTGECQILAHTDARIVASFIASNGRVLIPGIRSPQDLAAAEAERLRTPNAADATATLEQPRTPAEKAIMQRLGDRLVALGRERVAVAGTVPNP